MEKLHIYVLIYDGTAENGHLFVTGDIVVRGSLGRMNYRDIEEHIQVLTSLSSLNLNWTNLKAIITYTF